MEGRRRDRRREGGREGEMEVESVREGGIHGWRDGLMERGGLFSEGWGVKGGIGRRVRGEGRSVEEEGMRKGEGLRVCVGRKLSIFYLRSTDV